MATDIKRAQSPDTVLLGYWAAHEQYSMQDLLRFVVEAEKTGFTTTMTSDHLGGMIMLMAILPGYG